MYKVIDGLKTDFPYQFFPGDKQAGGEGSYYHIEEQRNISRFLYSRRDAISIQASISVLIRGLKKKKKKT